MGIYSRALRHIDMNRVKKLHEEKVEQKKLVEKEKERIKEELRNLNSPEFSNWRCELEEGMTSSGLFQTTLPATGDVNLETISTGDASSIGASQGSGDFDISGSYIQFDGEPSPTFRTSSFTVDASKYTTVTFSAIAGNDNNGGDTPSNPLIVYWISSSGKIGTLGSIPSNTSSLTQFTFDIPSEARGEGLSILFTDEPGDPITVDDTFYVGKTISSHPSTIGVGASYWIYEVIRLHPTWNNNAEVLGASASFRTLLAWSHLQSTYIGQTSDRILFPNWPADVGVGYPAPVSGDKSSVSLEDLEAIHSNIIATFGTDQTGRQPITYGITDLNFRRTTPITVFVPLDSPEATSFIRTDPIMANLSPEERRKKLQDMLDASDEYVEKILGSAFPGTGAVPPGEYDPFAQAPPGQAGDTPGVEIAQWRGSGQGESGPGFNPSSQHKNQGPFPSDDTNPYKGGDNYKWDPVMKIYAPNIKRVQNSPTGQDTQIAGTASFPPVEPGYGFRGRYDQFGREIDPKTGKPVLAPMSPPVKRVQKNKNRTMVAHHEPQGNLITERKKKLKSPEEIMNKIPGYYDGKPAPLGFPMEQPPKMVNGMHPDLVDGKKVADRFNRLDPQSAKAMPLTGNPHIDKKVRSARKNPK